MRKFLFLATIMMACFSNAQSKFTDYNLSYFPDKKTFSIEISENKGTLAKVWIQSYSMDNISKDGYIIIESKKIPDFINFMKFAKSKYEEWSNTAKENDVQELRKNIEFEKKFRGDTAFSYGKWQFSYGDTLSAVFLISKGDTNPKLIISTGKLQSSTNQYIKNEGLIIVFKDLQEIEDFIEKFNVDEMQKSLTTQEDKKNLFK